jgi:hypothetical protein
MDANPSQFLLRKLALMIELVCLVGAAHDKVPAFDLFATRPNNFYV